MRCSRVLEYEHAAPEPEGIPGGNRAVGCIGELEASHCVQANHPHPVGDQRILSTL
jgi:hypothetical protein